MAMAVIAWLIALPLLGAVTGMRSFTGMAVLCWYAHLGYFPMDGTWASWTGKLSVTIWFTVLAVLELAADKLPWIPARTSLGPALFRLSMGALIGAIVATGLDGPGIEGVILGVLGVLVGVYGGFLVRREIVERVGCPDWHVAVAEDALAIACAMLAMGVVTG
jgi:uncharacterized membrane protein